MFYLLETSTVESLYMENSLLLRSPPFVFPIESLAKSRLSRKKGLDKRPDSPKWEKGAAKLLDAGFDGEDWRALAELLGYRNKKFAFVSY